MDIKQYLKRLGLPTVIICDVCGEDLQIIDAAISYKPEDLTDVVMHHGLCLPKDIATRTTVIANIEFVNYSSLKERASCFNEVLPVSVPDTDN